MERQVRVVQKSITVSPSQSIRIGGHRLSLPQIQRGQQINLVISFNGFEDKLLDSDLCLLFRYYLRRLPTEFTKEVAATHRLATTSP